MGEMGGRATAECSPVYWPNNKRRLSLTVLRDNYFMVGGKGANGGRLRLFCWLHTGPRVKIGLDSVQRPQGIPSLDGWGHISPSKLFEDLWFKKASQNILVIHL
jgi:hypothetical protein